jgi:Flp pilus assembly protein TadG
LNPAVKRELTRLLYQHIINTFAGVAVLLARLAGNLWEAARSLLASAGGGVAVIWAASLLPAIMLFAGALQYSAAFSAQDKLDAIADAASLAAVSSAAATQYQNNGTTQQAYATSLFNSQAALVKGVTVTSLTVTVTPNAAGANSSLTATVSYAAKVKSFLPGVLGSFFTTISGTSTANSTLPTYMDFYLLLDDSPSMGIGATAADITAMQNANNGCAFACHSPDALDQSKYPGYTLPAVPGTQLRIDALRNATSQLISTAIAKEAVANQFRIGVYTFANTVTTVSDLTTNLSAVQTLINAIALPVTDLGTQIGDAVDWLSQNKVTASGTGARNSPLKWVILVTDGVEDQAFNYTPGNYDNLLSPVGSWYGTPYSAVMHSDACTSLKNKGVTVAVLYTQYGTLSDTRYTQMVAPFANNIATALQACASSPQLFVQAYDATQINAAMQQIFALALAKAAHLTQ